MSAQAMELEVVKPAAAPAATNIVTPMAMIDRALTTGASVEVLSGLMALQERWEANQARKEFDAAIASAKAKIGPVIRNKKGHNEKRYADFAAIASAVDPIISEFGLSYRFRTNQADRISVTCVLSHKAGHSEENTLSGPADTSGSKNAIQAIGSTLTYLQRYSLVQALGLAAADDDDGKSAEASAAVTEDQAAELRDLIEAVEADATKFCAFFRVQSIATIPAKRFDEAVKALRDFGRKNGARA